MSSFATSRPTESKTQQITIQIALLMPLLAVGLLNITHPLITALATILALGLWAERWFTSGILTKPAFLNGPLTLWIISAFMGIGMAYNPALSLPMLFVMLGSVSIFFAIINTSTSRRNVAEGLVLITSFVALYFVSQYAHFNYKDEVGFFPDLGRITGNFLPNLVFYTPHPNAIATFLESTFLLSLVLTFTNQGPKRWLWAATSFIITYGLLVTNSRGAWTALIVMGITWFLLQWSKRAAGIVLGGVLIVGLGVSLAIISSPHLSGQEFAPIQSTLETMSSRLNLYQNSFYLLRDYPFTGIGLGDTFAMVYSHYQLLIHVPYLYYAHNILLAVSLGQGLLGLIAFLWLLIAFYWFVYKAEQVGVRRQHRYIFRAAWLGVTATFVHGFMDASQFSDDRWTMVMLFALLGLAVATGRTNLGTRLTIPSSRSVRILGIAALAGIVVVLALFWRPIISSWYANMGALYQTKAELSPTLTNSQRQVKLAVARAYFDQAIALNPVQPTAHRRLGTIALRENRFEEAIAHLEVAYQQEPHNQAILKALGFAYLWNGQVETAASLLRQVTMQNYVIDELAYLKGEWQRQKRDALSAQANQMQAILMSSN
ncbi:MAG: O-antigen ligase family protein [Anaerolineae bacterium]|nr:O-antigen ligase family protein [Anaerolineae bacterium]